jgi:hypothetical protein
LLPYINPLTGKTTGQKRHALKHKENGNCIHLGATGCDVWENAPHVCRTLDCRVLLRYRNSPHLRKQTIAAAKRLKRSKWGMTHPVTRAPLSIPEQPDPTKG